MEIELWNGDVKAIIDPKGAWLTNLSDQNGDILFPRRSLKSPDGSIKIRGGSHVCLPNFGPDSTGDQPQHGFARTVVWRVEQRTASSVTLALLGGKGSYAALFAWLTYELLPAGLLMMLRVGNRGQAPIRCAPAFHPYFALGHTEDRIQMDGEIYKKDDLNETLFVYGYEHSLVTQSRIYELGSEGLPLWAQWTDGLASYVCFEPTLAGNRFLQQKALEEELLAVGQSRQYTMRMQWTVRTW
jgi:galactose mutarotase-like enzyme